MGGIDLFHPFNSGTNLNMRFFSLLFWCLLCAFPGFSQNFKIQVGAFADSVETKYFTDRGLDGVMIQHADDGIWRYFIGYYRTKEEAETIVVQLKERGFNFPVIVDMEAERMLSPSRCAYTSSRAEPFQEEEGVNPCKKLFFEHGKSDINADGRVELDRFFRQMKAIPTLELRIMGFTDNIGDAAGNMELAATRARAVRDYLIGKGIKPDRMFLEVFGESEPLYPNRDENGRELPQNQRWNNRVMLKYKK